MLNQIPVRVLRTIFQSATADDFCRNLVHSVLHDFGASAAAIATLMPTGNLVINGSYANPRENAAFDLSALEPARLMNRAILQGSAIYAALEEIPGDNGEGHHWSGPSISAPIYLSELVSGGLQIFFSGALQIDLVSEGIIKFLTVAAEPFLDIEGQPFAPPVINIAGTRGRRGRNQLPNQLTERQILILEQLATDATHAKIAKKLALSESTVKQEASRIFRYLEVQNRHQAVAAAKTKGLLLA
jgi:DNA-binding CsgD family transcriptional regulator